MAKRAVNLARLEGDFVFRFGRAHFATDPATGMLPRSLECEAWHGAGRGGRGRRASPERLILELEHSQATGDLDRVSAGLPSMEQLAESLEKEADRLRRLARRARDVCARHEPSAGERREP